MVGLEDLYLLNLFITTILLLATLYRVKIEREICRVTIENAKYCQALKKLRQVMEREKDILNDTDAKEFYQFLREWLDEIDA